MPRVVAMTWVASQRRWTKMHKGTRYYVSCKELGTDDTQAASVNAANLWWQTKLDELRSGEPKPVKPGTPEAQIAALEKLTGFCISDDADALAAQIAVYSNYEPGKLPDGIPELVLGPERIEAIKAGVETLLNPPAVPPEKTVGRLVALWVESERQRERSGNVGASRANMNRICLEHFADFLGTASAVEIINELKWQEFFSHVADKVAKRTWGMTHANRVFAVAKRFVRYLWELRLIELPRNLDSKRFSFKLSPSEIEVWTIDEIKKFLAPVNGQTRLHVLLMLNCGMLGKDISDLSPKEVDWKEGIITRKRSKTEAHESVPVVQYKLWAQTLKLLKEHRSDDPERVLLTTGGTPWITEQAAEGSSGFKRSDKVASCFKYWGQRTGVKKPPKALRATAASKLAEHHAYKFYAQYYLGQSPRTVADKHYVKPNDKEFFEALSWLESALNLK